MIDIVTIASAILLLVGSVFTLIGSIGIVRMPDKTKIKASHASRRRPPN